MKKGKRHYPSWHKPFCVHKHNKHLFAHGSPRGSPRAAPPWQYSISMGDCGRKIKLINIFMVLVSTSLFPPSCISLSSFLRLFFASSWEWPMSIFYPRRHTSLLARTAHDGTCSNYVRIPCLPPMYRSLPIAPSTMN